MAASFPIYRRNQGRGKVYLNREGRRITDTGVLEAIEKLVIPPAWQDVIIDLRPRSKVRATGIDSKGRRQYIYSEAHIKYSEAKKYSHMIEFAQALPRMRRHTAIALKHKKYDREKVLAAMVRLLDEGHFRPGNEQYAKQNDTFGLTTLRSRHVDVKGSDITFDFIGKKGVHQRRTIKSSELAPIVRHLDNIPGYEVFKFFDEDGKKHDVKSDDLNEYIQEVMGEGFTAKDFRTWGATKQMAMELAKSPPPDNPTAMKRVVSAAVRKVSESLGNTPAVARRSYIDPKVISAYQEGRTIATLEDVVPHRRLSKTEAKVLALLEKAG